MNFKNCETSDPHRMLPNLSDKIDIKRSDKYVVLSNLSIYYTWKIMKKWYKSNKFKISATSWNKNLGLRDGSYSVSDSQGNFENIMKKHDTFTDEEDL